jgi:GGDEF domain-containing protein
MDKCADLRNDQGLWPNAKKSIVRFFKTLTPYFSSLNTAGKLMLGFVHPVVQGSWLNLKRSIARLFKTLVSYLPSLNIARKLMLGFIPLVVLLVSISVFAIFNLSRLNSLSDSILKTDTVIIAESEKIIDTILDQELYVRRYLILKTKDLLETFWERDKQFKQLLTRVTEVSEGRDYPIDEITSLHNEYNYILIKLSVSRFDSSSSKGKKLEKEIKEKQEAIITLIKGMAAEAHRDQNKKTGMTSAIGTTAFKGSVIFCVLGLFLSVAAAMLITRNISGAVKKLSLATEKISKGEFDYTPDIKNNDELGSLSDAFIKMANRLKQLEVMSLDTSPLTRLPGGISIEKTMQKLIASGDRTAFCLLDIDNFKAYNDYYGYANGNELIKATAEIIGEAVAKFGSADDFVGHIGGDDFVVITKPDSYKKVCTAITGNFDKAVPDFYDDKVRKCGYIVSENREGEQASFPIASLSIAVVTNSKRELSNYVEFGEVAAEMKKYAKSISGSVCVVDKRTKNTSKAEYQIEMNSLSLSVGEEKKAINA